MNLDCLICSESKPIQECGQHTFCLKCLAKIKSSCPDEEINIVCPSDTSKTVSSEQQGLPKFKTHFGKRLVCDECTEWSFLDKCWWCPECQSTVCSNCAMENHKDHPCKHWDLTEFAKSCSAIYHRYALAVDTSAVGNNGPSSLEEKVHSYCQQLEQELKKRLDFGIQSQRLLINLADKFGVVPTTSAADTPPQQVDENKLEKMLNILTHVINNNNNTQNGNNCFPAPNFDTLKKLPPKPVKLTFPSVDNLIGTVFGESHDIKDAAVTMPTGSVVNPTIVPDLADNLDPKLRWIKSADTNLTNVWSMCSTGDHGGVIIVDDRGVHEFNEELTLKQSRDWSDWPQKNALVFPYLNAYHKDRDSVLVTREINAEKDVGCVNEYSLTTGLQQCSKKIDLPVSTKDEDFIAPRLISVLSDGRLVCASGLDGTACIWIKSFSENAAENAGKWTKAWSSGTLKKFLSLYVITTFENNKEYLYIESDGFMYEFLLTKWKTRFIRSYEIRRSCYSYNFFVWNNQLYYLNRCDSRLSPCFECNHKECNLKEIEVENLHLTKQRCFICANKDGTLIYLLNSTDNKLHVGKLS